MFIDNNDLNLGNTFLEQLDLIYSNVSKFLSKTNLSLITKYITYKRSQQYLKIILRGKTIIFDRWKIRSYNNSRILSLYYQNDKVIELYLDDHLTFVEN